MSLSRLKPPNKTNRWKARSVRSSAFINSVNRTSNRLRRWRATYLSRHPTIPNLSMVMTKQMATNFLTQSRQVEEANPMRTTEATIRLKSSKASQHRLRILSNPSKLRISKQLRMMHMSSKHQLINSHSSNQQTCLTCWWMKISIKIK